MTARKRDVHIMIDALMAQNRLPRGVQDKSAKLIMQMKNDASGKRHQLRKHCWCPRPTHEIGSDRPVPPRDRFTTGVERSS